MKTRTKANVLIQGDHLAAPSVLGILFHQLFYNTAESLIDLYLEMSEFI